MSQDSIFKGITRNVFILGVVSLFTDIASEMLYPVIPIFLTAVLGAPMPVVGLIEGIAESTSSVFKVLSGWFSDLIKKRKPFVIAGYSFSSFAKPLLFFAYSWPAVLFARFLDRTGKGLRTSARDAMIADSTDEAYRGKAFGFHRAMDSIGACIGPLLAIWLLFIFKGDLRLIFLIAFIPAAIGVFILIAFLEERAIRKNDKSPVLRFSEIGRFGPDFRNFLLISLVFAVGNSSDAFLRSRSYWRTFFIT
ncbi:MAG: MFS transporter [Candidatus Omnitrophica bacterium]|nr:MFS transporter [Candidatus Omnitrophota bacterium]